MLIIAHRVNTAAQLESVPDEYGIEIDVRHDSRTGGLYLNHEPGMGEDLDGYLKRFRHAFIVFNIKEAGIEQRCIDLAKKHKVARERYFLLDVEFPYLYTACGFASRDDIRAGKVPRDGFVHEIAARYSEAEPIEQALALKGLVDWVWIDTNTHLPLDASTVKRLRGFKTCLVCPERWGRQNDIPAYAKRLRELRFTPDAVMARVDLGKRWLELMRG
jgi:hypothetical protein